MKRPIWLRLYAKLDGLLGVGFGIVLWHRKRIGKEDSARLGERSGHAELERPDGKLVWLHGASVGESALALALAEEMRKISPDLGFLFTSQTRTSADFLSRNMNASDRHQYVPMDTGKAMRRFIGHWQPDLAILLESEIWPNLIMRVGAAKIPLALVNGRMNEKSRSSWAKKPKSAKYLFGKFNWISAADPPTAKLLAALTGREIAMAGNLKMLAKPMVPDEASLAHLSSISRQRLIWLAASTHPGEEEIILQAHQQVLQNWPTVLLILVPRHPERAGEISKLAEHMKLTYCRRADPFVAGKSVWIADTIGEMPLWLKLADIAFIGGSLGAGKGHNPLEAIWQEVPVLSGSQVASFANIYQQLEKISAVRYTNTANEISIAIAEHFDDPQICRPPMKRAHKWIQSQADDLAKNEVTPLLELLKKRR